MTLSLRIAGYLLLLGVVLIGAALACDKKMGGTDNYGYVALFIVGVIFAIIALIIFAGVGVVSLAGYHV